ncbi:5'-methylthioadenosine/S-adenosylhomocysteine nucleosidase [Caulobacter sp. KR2-114]|uniref:5'-methylthioadenosine/S-adenosylhomocysteine nucleosidase n=1 Tax=Caulobacter sp. KR2-114 TaxID=3400912 RepID=UPI003C109AF3
MRPPVLMLIIAVLVAPLAARAQTPAADPTPRIVVMSAFPPEMTQLRAATTDAREVRVAGVSFVTGTLEGRPVVLVLSGMSMVNAAMTTQMALDHFPVRAIVFSGIAGGIDPGLSVGDVVAPDAWAEYLDGDFLRAGSDGRFAATRGHVPAYGMLAPRPVTVVAPDGTARPMDWLPADPALLAVARSMPRAELKRCAEDAAGGAHCLGAPPRLVVGGHGLSGPVFMDNADYRADAFATFHAQVLDMESAAVAHVAYANATPFIAFRSLSDLAGGGAEDQVRVFMRLASDNSATVVRGFLRALPAR